MKYLMMVAILLLSLSMITGCDKREEKSSHYSNETQFTVQEFDARKMNMPSFELVSAGDGQTLSSSDYEGQVLFITFFESWCGTCREGINSLKQIQEKFHGQGFSVIALSIPQDDPLVLRELAEKAGLNYPLLIGTKEMMEKFGVVTIVPVSFLVDRSGYIVKKYLNHIDLHVIEQDIEKLLPSQSENNSSQT